MNDHSHPALGFIGGGNMAASIIGGLVRAGWPANRILVSDPAEAQRNMLSESHGVAVSDDNNDVFMGSDVVVLAVKPQMMEAVVMPLGEALSAQPGDHAPLLISIAAGIPGSAILGWLGRSLPLVRVMPNTPALIGKGVSGLFASAQTSDTQKQLADSIMQAVGETVWVEDEPLIDAVTGVSGSGPAYFFKLMELMIAEGVASGLDPAAARKLVVQTGLGAASLLADSELDAAELRRQVTSPNGTTQAGIEAMEQYGIDQAVSAGVRAATDRSVSLSAELTDGDSNN